MKVAKVFSLLQLHIPRAVLYLSPNMYWLHAYIWALTKLHNRSARDINTCDLNKTTVYKWRCEPRNTPLLEEKESMRNLAKQKNVHKLG